MPVPRSTECPWKNIQTLAAARRVILGPIIFCSAQLHVSAKSYLFYSHLIFGFDIFLLFGRGGTSGIAFGHSSINANGSETWIILSKTNRIFAASLWNLVWKFYRKVWFREQFYEWCKHLRAYGRSLVVAVGLQFQTGVMFCWVIKMYIYSICSQSIRWLKNLGLQCKNLIIPVTSDGAEGI